MSFVIIVSDQKSRGSVKITFASCGGNIIKIKFTPETVCGKGRRRKVIEEVEPQSYQNHQTATESKLRFVGAYLFVAVEMCLMNFEL